jgi:spermidine synthase
MDARLGLLLACFFLSGFAALLYQTAWTRELSFVFGTSELAVAAVLAAYMGGLALGAAAAARWAHRLRRPVLAYGLLELAIALSALSVPFGIRAVNGVYVALLGGAGELPGSGASVAALFQLGAAFAVLLPPTVFMGATLPLLARHAVRSEAQIGTRVGGLYAVNTAGAVAGTLCAAFWLMPELGLRRTVWTGAALNGVVFALAALLARGARLPAGPAIGSQAPAGAGRARWILPAIAVSGGVSFTYEVLWTRLLGYLVGESVQAFATMLASFLLGITLGSAAAGRLAARRERAGPGFAAAQLGIALTSYSAFALADRLPGLARELGAGFDAPLASAALAAATLLPITLCIGATFPFAVRVLARRPEQAAAAAARVYAWNTLGAIAGALGAGYVLLPGLGFEWTLGLGVALSLGLAAATALGMRPRRTRLAGLAVAAGVGLLVVPPQAPWELLRWGPMARKPVSGEIVYMGVGRSSTVLVLEQGAQWRLSTNGLPESVIDRAGVLPLANVARWMGMLPSLLRPAARDLLAVGLGGGMLLETAPSSIERLDVIELEPEVLRANRSIAAARAIDPLADPRVRVHIGDARGTLQLTQRRYDAILSQPSHPWTAGASHLYTREFFRLVRSRLGPDGVFVQWIGFPVVDEELLRSLAASLVEVFGHVELYEPEAALLFVASAAPLEALEGAARTLREHPAHYARFGIHRLEDFAAARVLDEDGMRQLAQGAVPNTDDRNLLAARASRLGRAALGARSARALWKDIDVLLGDLSGLDRSALIRRLVSGRFRERALAVAASASGASKEAGLGWVELEGGSRARAASHFARALALAPQDADAAAGWVSSRRSERAPRDLSEADPDGRIAAVLAGWRHDADGDREALEALDVELAAIAPGEPLFEEAARLRIRWRLGAPDPETGAAAQAIAETLLLRRWNAGDALLRARAAFAAGRPLAAWGSLQRISERLPRRPWARPVAAQALSLAKALPDDLVGDLPERLADLATPSGRPRAPRGSR